MFQALTAFYLYSQFHKNLFSFLKRCQFKNLASDVSKNLPKDGKILEIGFGNGELLLALKEKGFKNVYGSDFTDDNFGHLKNKEIVLKASNIEETFPFDEKFDGIIMNNVIEHFLNPLKVLNSCKNNLAENGIIVLITPNSDALEFPIFKKYWAGFHAPRHLFIFNKKNIKTLGMKLGFSEISIKSATDPGQWSISVQNILQDKNLTKAKLTNGMAWYLIPLSMIFSPISILQNVAGNSTSMIVFLKR